VLGLILLIGRTASTKDVEILVLPTRGIAGISLSNQTDVLATRLHLGSALGAVVLLAVATNLPEIAITVTAALSGNLGVAVGNILGGIAIQTVVLVAVSSAA
jgi:cation:H+ antiporter